MNTRTPMAVLLFAGLTLSGGFADAQPAPASVMASGITASVTPVGHYQIQTQQPAWTFTGTVGHPLTSQTSSTGTDSIGQYQEIAFGYTDTVQRSASIRAYQNTP